MSEKRKFSVTLFVCLALAVVAFVLAFVLEGDKQMWAIGGAFVFGIYSLIGYSCENATKVPDNYV